MTYDDSQLMKLFEELSPKNQKKALKGAMTRAANTVKRKATANLKAAKGSNGKTINTSTGLPKGIRRVLYKTKLGFRVTVGTKNTKRKSFGYHQGRAYRRAQRRVANGEMSASLLSSYQKPVLLWAEGGTKQRHTKTATKIFRRLRSGHSTGAMPRYGFMERTKQQMKPQIDGLLKDEIVKNIQRIARKYGCRVN